MLNGDLERLYPSAKTLVKEHVASRMHDKDATLFDFSEDAQKCAEQFMGWTDLASNPPTPVDKIAKFAESVLARGLRSVILIGEGGSTQAPMTITKYNKDDSGMVRFRTMDSTSPVRIRGILAECKPESTLVMVSSKSGTTIETRSSLLAVREVFSDALGHDEMMRHLVAVTDPGSDLERLAKREGWLAVFNGEPSVGGRYSALSVFGLVPTALVGIDMGDFMDHARAAEKRCSEDSIDNPAVQLAAFLYDNYLQGRDKFCFLTPRRGRVLGLWIEQLVAESLGKEGKGILPNIEVDPLMLTKDAGDRTAIMYQTHTDLWDERKNFEMSLAYMDPQIPHVTYRVDGVCELPEHFLMWEYAIAMCGYLMKVCPFDQPDVATAKAEVLKILNDGQVKPDFVQDTIGDMAMGDIEVRLGESMKGADDLEGALHELFESVRPGDYFALNAFVPFTGEGRREALELIRHAVAKRLHVVSCLEVGPRYLHSTGQLQKGGPNTGVFLIVSADELKDIPLFHAKAPSLAALSKAQAEGDLVTLSSRGRRVVHLHLPDNSGIMLHQLGEVVQKVLREL